jgi:hypothetical protein
MSIVPLRMVFVRRAALPFCLGELVSTELEGRRESSRETCEPCGVTSGQGW